MVKIPPLIKIPSVSDIYVEVFFQRADAAFCILAAETGVRRQQVMKVKSDITLFASEEPEISYRTSAGKNAEKDIKDRKTVFAGNLNGTDTLTERIRQKKEKARQEAC